MDTNFTFIRDYVALRNEMEQQNSNSQSTTTSTAPALIATLPTEIFQRVCQELLPAESSVIPRDEVIPGRQALRNLALACGSGNREVALDCLWSCLGSLEPLVKLLPNIDLDDRRSYFFNGGAIDTDSPFRRYAARVRTLDLVSRRCRISGYEGASEEELRPAIHPQVFVLLARELAGQPLLPRLRKIIIQCGVLQVDSQYELAALSALYSPSVETVELRKGRVFTTSYYHRFLPLAMQQFPSLKRLTVESKDQAGGRAYPLLCRVSEMTNLESLDLRLPGSGIDVEPLLDLLRKLNRLTSITLDVHFEFHETTRRDFRCRAASLGLTLENLKSVHLFNRADASLCQCIPDALLERVTHLTVIAKPDTTIGGPSGLFSTDFIGRLARIPTLKRLDLEGGAIAGTDVLLPIVRQLGLVELNIHADQGPQPSPFTMVQLARARETPTLKILSIGRHTGMRHADAQLAQVTSLQHIAEDTNPGLEYLALELLPSSSKAAWRGLAAHETPRDFASKWLNALRRFNFVPKSAIRTLGVRVPGWTRATNPQEMRDLAHILDIIFPSLEEIRPFADDGYNQLYWLEEWSHIEELHKFYRRDRLSRGG